MPNKRLYNEKFDDSQLNLKQELESIIGYIESSGGLGMGRASASHHCFVCDGVFVSKFSLKRHMGVKHNVNEEGKSLTSEQLEYLRRQSDHRYIRNRERPTCNQCLIKPANSQLPIEEVLFDVPVKHGEKQFVLVDPMLLDKILSRMNVDDYLESMCTKPDSAVLFRSDDRCDADDKTVRSNCYRQSQHAIGRSMGDRHSNNQPVHRQSQRQHDQASIPVCSRPSKNKSSSKRQWICY